LFLWLGKSTRSIDALYCKAIVRSCIGLFLALPTALVHANAPIILDDFVSEPGRLKLDVSIAYSNSDRAAFSAGDPLLIQTGPTSFVEVPTAMGQGRHISDSVVGTLSLRYSLRNGVDIYGRTSYLSSSSSVSAINSINKTADNYLVDFWGGLSWTIRDDRQGPGVVGFAEVSVFDRYGGETSSIKSFSTGATFFKAIDPIVFLVTGVYRYNLWRDGDVYSIKPGNVLIISPIVGFAANEKVTIKAGVQWANRRPDQTKYGAVGLRRTGTDLVMGVGYSFNPTNLLNANFNIDTSGRGGAELRLSWIISI